jgi:Tol biopolymer transport system component/DNA-binding winged helix-turn-helix (wHTH) protein
MSDPSAGLYTFGCYQLDATSRVLTRSGAVVTLAPKTFDLLVLMAESGGRLLSKRELMEALWPNTFVEETNLSFQISTLRKTLGEEGIQWIETVPKHGYRFATEVKRLPVNPELKPSKVAEPRAPLRKKPWVLGTAVAVGVAIAFVIVAVKRIPMGSSRESERSSPAVPLTAYPGYERQPTLSPDGSQVAFSWNGASEDNSDIYVKLVGPGPPLRLTTDPAWDDSPAWSPDGRLIAFLRFTTLVSADVVVIPALGGAERKVSSISVAGNIMSLHDGKRAPVYSGTGSAGNLAWTPDGKWIAFGGSPSDDQTQGIWLIAPDGVEKRRLTKTGEQDFGDWAPTFSTDGQKLAFIREHSISGGEIYVLPMSSTLTPAGVPTRVTRKRAAIGGLAWTTAGDLLFSSGGHLGLTQMWKITPATRSGEQAGEPQLLPVGEHATGMSLSRSGRLVYSALYRNANIWKLALDGRNPPSVTPLVHSTFDEETPDYSPDGQRLAFASTRTGVEELYISGAAGSNPLQVTSMGGSQCSNPRWSRDGKAILFNSRREGSADLYLLRPETGALRRITDDPAEELEPRWSRDGRVIYFGSNRTGRMEVWRMPASGGPAVRITKDGGMTASESPDGRFLYYAKRLTTPTSIWRVPVGGGEEKLFVDGLTYALNFVIADRGLYLLAVGDAPDKTSIDFVEYATGKRTTVLKVGKQFWYGMALSPDQRSLLYSVIDSAGSNLMLVEHSG